MLIRFELFSSSSRSSEARMKATRLMRACCLLALLATTPQFCKYAARAYPQEKRTLDLLQTRANKGGELSTNQNPQAKDGQPQLVVQLGHSAGISSACFSPDGRFIVSGSAGISERKSLNNAAILWETSTGREIRRFVGHSDSINAVSFSPDGRLS